MEDQDSKADAPAGKVKARETKDFWKKWVKAAEKAAKQHKLDTEAAYKEYEKAKSQGAESNASSSDDRSTKPYPLYWSSVETLRPALYSRTPKVSTRRRQGVDNQVAILASKGVERLADYLLDCSDFDEVMTAATMDFIHADKMTAQLKLEEESEEVETEIQVPLVTTDGTNFTTSDGAEYLDEVMQNPETGEYFGIATEVTTQTKKHINVLPLLYDEYLHTPDAKSPAEITERAYSFSLEKEDAEARFGDKINDKIQWQTHKGQECDDERDKNNDQLPGKYLNGYEIWDKKNKKVLWVSGQFEEYILDIKSDPYGLTEFFPSPTEQLGSKPAKHLYPTPAFIQCRENLEFIHDLQSRCFKLAKGIRRRALVNGAMEELITALTDLEENEFIAVTNLQNIVEKGGLEGNVLFMPVMELVQSLNELMTLKDSWKNDYYDTFGIPDILRGSSDPLETAAAQTIKERSAHDRFKYKKKQVAMLASDLIQGMVDLALSAFEPEYVAEIVGVSFLSPKEQEIWPAAYELLISDKTRKISIDIDIDSLTFVDEMQRAEQATNAVSATLSGLQTISQMMTPENPQPGFATIGLKAIMLSLDHLPMGKEFQQGVAEVAGQLMEQLQNPPEPPPPPPDYEQMKLEVQNQKLQLEMQKMQMDNQNKQIDLTLKQQKQMGDAEIEAAKLRLQTEQQIYDQAAESARLKLEAMWVFLEELKIENARKEAIIEEIRLAREADQLEQQSQREALMGYIEQQRAEVAEAKTRPVTVSFVVPKSQRRVGRLIDDGTGNLRVEEDEPQVTEYETITQQIPAGEQNLQVAMPTVAKRSSQVQFDQNDNPTLIIDEALNRIR